MRRVWLFSVLIAACTISSSISQIAEEVVVVCAGDVLLSGGMLPVMRRRGVQFPFEQTAEVLRSADIAICNLEAPFGEGGEPFNKKFAFRVPPKWVKGLSHAGFDLVSLANNHIMDYGVKPLRTTLSLLKREGIGCSGAGLDIGEARRPAILDRKGLKVGFLSYSNTFPTQFYASRSKPGTAPGYERYLREDIRKVKEEVDFLIVAFHWGEELSTEPQPYQTRLGRMAVDLGADLVLGHHPHVSQGIEVYRSGIIAYSLGNFAFGSVSKKAKGILLRVRVSKDGVRKGEVIPLKVRNDLVGYQPRILKGGEAEVEINRIKDLSLPFRTEITFREGVGIIGLP